MRRALALAAMLALAAGAADAHRLRVFATVEPTPDGGATVAGHGFFAGGGRAAGARVTATDPAGGVLHEGRADAEGRFAFPAPEPPPGSLRVTIDAGDGHRAETTLSGDRFPGPRAAPRPDAAAPATSPVAPAAAADRPSAAGGDAPAGPPDDAALAALVEAAVARQLRPLLEAQAEAAARVRFADVAGGVGMIVGMGGAALWAMARRRPRP